MKQGLSKGSKKILIFGGIGLALVLAIMVVINSLIPKQEVSAKVGAIDVVKGDVKELLDVTGTVKSVNTKMFFSPVNAKITTMDFEVGDVVQKGTKLVTFDLEDLEKNNEKAELNVRSGQLDYEDAINQDNKNYNKKVTAQANAKNLQGKVNEWQAYVENLKKAIHNANVNAQNDAIDASANETVAQLKQYQQDIKQYKKEEAKLRKSLDAKQRVLDEANTNFGIIDNKHKAGAATDADYEVASKAQKKAQNDFNQVQQTYNSLVQNQPSVSGTYDAGSGAATADTYDLQTELENASSYLAELKGDLAQEEAKADADTGRLTDETKEKMQIGTNLASIESQSVEELIMEGRKGISAEFTGVISSVSAAAGATVAQGMELFVLQSTEKMSIDVKVSKYDYAKVKKGQKAVITLAGNEYQGTVEKVNRIAMPDAQGNPTVGATISIDKPDENVFIGVEAKVLIQAAEAKDALVVPSEVINIGKDGSFCHVIEDGVIVKRPVETGVASTSSVEVKSGLKAGDKVITDIGDFKEGDKVEGVDPSELEENPMNEMMEMMN